MKIYFNIFVGLSIIVISFASSDDSLDKVAYSRYGACRTHKPTDDSRVKSFVQKAIPILAMDKPKGYLGTVGIVGGSVYSTSPAYFAAMAALRVGADAVHIFCTKLAGPPLQALNPDVIVHPLHDVNVEKMILEINTMDVVVLGPGLDKEPHTTNTVIPRVLAACKAAKKPLVVDLDEFFLTQAVLNTMLKYPAPGIIITLNGPEFEKLYKLVKGTNSFSDAHVSIDFDKLGENILFLRKGCTDMAISQNPLSSWSLSEGGSSRRTSGQGDMIAGASAVYFYWAVNTIPTYTNSTYNLGPMFPAAVGSYSAAKMMRAANKQAFEEKGRSTLTSDMLNKVQDVLYGNINIMDDQSTSDSDSKN